MLVNSNATVEGQPDSEEFKGRGAVLQAFVAKRKDHEILYIVDAANGEYRIKSIDGLPVLNVPLKG